LGGCLDIDRMLNLTKAYRPLALSERRFLMKRSVLILTLVAVAFTFTSGQVKHHTSVEAGIVALEKRAFEAWKNKDKRFFEAHMAEDGQYLDLNGTGGKAQYVQVIIDNNCTVNSYALEQTKVTMLSKEVALLTYRYTYDIVCEGKPEAGPLWASTLYVKRDGKWLIAFHQEIPAAQAK
jgi:uncharacterized protein (TIGR02246 family)